MPSQSPSGSDGNPTTGVLGILSVWGSLGYMRVQIENQAFAPTEVYRLITTATLLTSTASQAILGNETVASAFLSPLDGIVDAVADAIMAETQTVAPTPTLEALVGIRDSEGPPLNTACIVACDAGTGVRADGDANASFGSRPACGPCLAGSYSLGGRAAECQLCRPGVSLQRHCFALLRPIT